MPTLHLSLSQQATAALQRHLDQLLARIPHLQQIIVTDKEGIEIAQGQSGHTTASTSVTPKTEQLYHITHCANHILHCAPYSSPLSAVDHSLSLSPLSSTLPSLYATAAEQAGKLGIGHNQYLITTFPNHTLLQLNLLPVVVTLVASPDVNVGLLVNAIPELRVKLETTRQTVAALVNDMAKDRQQ